MASLEARTSTSNTLGGEYQVFLSFRGLDTRYGFTNCLYHALVDAGIRVFIDDEELRPGERISGNLLRAIDDSKLYIPIFSKNYASSHWCLRELAKMVENSSKSKEDGEKVILPIFYDVKPDDVKLKTTLYREAISNLEQKMEDEKKKFNSKDVETWRQALEEVDGTKGWELEKYLGCMIKVLDNNNFWMHDQFKDLGRAISKKERTRLCEGDDTICESRSMEIKESVQALCLQTTSWEPTTITAEQLRRFPHLKFLWLSDVVCEENVVVMNLRCFNLNKDEISHLFKGAMKLKALTLESTHGTPTFLEYSALEKLTIYDCPSLREIDCSIGKLRRLTDLSLELCSNLKKLSEQIGELKNLQHLSLSKCDSLSELPDSIVKLESLVKLDISHTPIAKVPSKMSNFLGLQTLNLEHHHRIKEWPELPRSLTTLRLTSASLLTIPNLSNLSNLVELFLSDGSGSWLPTSNVIPTSDLRWIGRLSNLSKLHLCLLNICAPTIELGSLSLLKELTLSGLDFRTLKQLPSNLIVLNLYHTRVKHVHLSGIPPLEKSRENEAYEQLDGQSLDVLDSLDEQSLHAILRVKSRRILPEDPRYNELQAPELIEPWRGNFLVLSSLKMLREFHMGTCRKVEVIDFVSPLESLEVFTVKQCCSLRRIKGLSNLKKLKRLHIEFCEKLRCMQGIHELEFLQLFRVYGDIYFVRIFDASSSKIPNECQMDITSNCNFSGKWDTYHGKLDTYHGNWESFREMIWNDKKEMRDALIEFGYYETSDSET